MTAMAIETHAPNIRDQVSEEEWAVRVDLAAAYRLVAYYGWDDLIFTHLSARVPGPEHHFLINPYTHMFDEITAYGFLEAGSIRLIDGERQTLAGTGVGLKLRARKSLSAHVDVAWPLKSTPAADGGHVTQAGEPRVHVRVGAEF